LKQIGIEAIANGNEIGPDQNYVVLERISRAIARRFSTETLNKVNAASSIYYVFLIAFFDLFASLVVLDVGCS
jgi:hypothetical protein